MPPQAHINKATEVAGRKAAKEIIGEVSSSKDDMPAPATTTPSTMPIKAKAKAKKKTKKKSEKSRPSESSKSDTQKGRRAADKIDEDWIKEEGHQRALEKDFNIIKTLWAELSLLAQDVTQFDMMPYLDRINKYWQDIMGKPHWSMSFIWSIEMVRKKFNDDLTRDDLTENRRLCYTSSLVQMKEYKTVPMPKSRGTSNAVPLFIMHLGRVFIDIHGKRTRVLEGEAAHTVNFSLLKLHKREATCRCQESNINVGSQCSVCAYSADNHDSINNHIRSHYQMGLICAYCYRLELTMAGMVANGEDSLSIYLKLDKEKKSSAPKS